MSQAGTFLTFNPSSLVMTLTGNTGGPVPPTGGNINILGSDGATFTGNPGTSTLTLSFNYLALPVTDTMGNGLISFGGTTYIQEFGTRNFFLGPNAGNTTLTVGSATDNNALGSQALHDLTTGANNIGIGSNSGGLITTGSRNVGVGSLSSLGLLTSGTSNTAIGTFALGQLATGNNNIALGDSAGNLLTGAESNNILIDSGGVLGESNTIRIGVHGTQTNCYIVGIDGVNVGSTATVVTESADHLGTAVITAGTGITVTPGANTITIAATAPAGAVTTLHTQDGNNVTATAGVINLSGGSNLTTTGTAGPNTATISLSGITQHSLQVGGAANSLTQLGVATNGQLPIGSTGADPVLATLTAGAGVSITNGAGSITISSTGGGVTWSVITANQTAAVNNGYFCNKAGTLALALPAASAVGDAIEVSNINTASGIQFTQAAGQQIFIANTSTTLGATGTLTSTQIGDSLKIVCSAANTTWWVVSFDGNWTPA